MLTAELGTPTSEPSPHLISTEDGTVGFCAAYRGGASRNSTEAVLMLAIDKTSMMTKLGFISLEMFTGVQGPLLMKH